MADFDFQLDQVKLAARLYYVDSISQVEVARILEISQAKVSRLLQLAREKGIVRITVDEYVPRHAELERDVREIFGLSDVVVIRNISDASSTSIRHNVGYFGAAAVATMIRSGQVVGVSGGRAVGELVRQMKPAGPVSELRIVPLMGSIGAEVNGNDPVELGRHLADIYDGSFYALNTPAFVTSAASRMAFLAQGQVKSIWRLYDEMSVAIVGIGALDSSFVDRRVLDADDLRRLDRAGAVGEICGRFYDAQGKECQSDFAKRVVSIELANLRRIPQVVGVTAGADRAEAVAIAARAGLLKALVVDELCATAMARSFNGVTAARKKRRAKVRS